MKWVEIWAMLKVIEAGIGYLILAAFICWGLYELVVLIREDKKKEQARKNKLKK